MPTMPPHKQTERKTKRKAEGSSAASLRRRGAKAAKPVRAIERAIGIMGCFSDTRPELTLQEISNATGIHKATAFRILTTLLRDGLVAQSTPGGTYTLGFAPIRYADTVLRSDGVRTLAAPLMSAVRDAVHETIVLSIRRGDDLVDIDKADGTWTIRKSPMLGTRRALHLEPAGIALLSALDPAERDRYFARTETNAQAGATLSAEKGFADRRAKSQDRARRSMAIDDHSGTTVAAVICADDVPAAVLWTAIPVDRQSADLQRTCLDQLCKAAEEISSRLTQSD
jgi:DNA-binding IclR family transcriptional regulator